MNRVRLSLCCLCAVVLGLGALRLRFDAEILNLLPGYLPPVQGLKFYQRHFSSARELIILVESAEGSDSETTARSLAQLLREETNLVSEVIWQSPWAAGGDAAAELIATLWLNRPPAEVKELEQRLTATNLPRVAEESYNLLGTSLSPADIGLLSYDPFGLLRVPASVRQNGGTFDVGSDPFISNDERARLLFVEAEGDLEGYKECQAWMRSIRELIQQTRRDGSIAPETGVRLTGRPAFVDEISTGMERDLAGSSSGTLTVIAALFWLSHRRFRPLLGLLCLLVFILIATMAVGGMLLGSINVVSLGFAAMLLGLAEDFGIVTYQEFRSHPDASISELRRIVGPGILWSTLTTSGAFLLLNLSGLPGLGQLGTLVALGIALACVVMLYIYLPLLPRLQRRGDKDPKEPLVQMRWTLFSGRRVLPARAAWCLTLLLLCGASSLLWIKGPHFDHSADVLKPRKSEATETLAAIQSRFGGAEEPLWILVPGKDDADIARRMDAVERELEAEETQGRIQRFKSPSVLWPRPENQSSNKTVLVELVERKALFHQAAEKAGFNAEALRLTESVLKSWAAASKATNVFWPAETANRWLAGKLMARTVNGPIALFMIEPATNQAVAAQFVASIPAKVQDTGAILSGWQLLGSTVFDLVVRELPWVLTPIFLLVLASLILAFKSLTDVLLSLSTLVFAGLCLAAVMALLGWQWNLLNLTAIPLLLGMGVDFSIHIILGLKRSGGDVLATHRSMGRALLLAGSTTIAGFASLSFSSNSGMASLGKVCALGIGLTLVTAVYLLPAWWCAARKTRGV